MAGEEEGETLHGAPQGVEDIQDLHEAASANTEVNSSLSTLSHLQATFGNVQTFH